MNRNKFTIALLIMLLPAVGVCGSVFSGGAFGLQTNLQTGKFAGMGILGLGWSDSSSVGFLNPAVWAGINVTRFSAGAGISRFYSKDEFNYDVSDDFVLEYTALGIALKPGLIMGFSIYPHSRIDYRLTQTKWLGDLKYEEFYIGKGGISGGSALLSARLSSRLWMGAGVDLIFGSLSTLWGVDFASSAVSDAQFVISDQTLGFRPTLGMYYQIDENSSLGLFLAAGSKVNVTEEFDYNYADSVSFVDKEFEFPPMAGIGYSFYISDRLQGGIDFLWTGWNKKEQSIGISSRYQQSQFFGIGLERSPLIEPLAPFRQKLSYRCGFSYRNLYYQYPDGKTVGEIAFSTGLGIPLRTGYGRMDFALSGGKRGDLNLNEAQEYFIDLSVFINIGEKWFVRKKRY